MIRKLIILSFLFLFTAALPYGANPWGAQPWGVSAWNANPSGYNPLSDPSLIAYWPLGESYEELGSDVVTGWDLTVGWVAYSAAAVNSSSFETIGSSGGMYKDYSLSIGSRYRLTISAECAKSGTFRIYNGIAANIIFEDNSSPFVSTFDFTAVDTEISLHFTIASRTITVNSMTLQQLTTQDVIGSYDGTFPNGNAYATGQEGDANTAMDFDGANQYVTMGDVLNVTTGDFSIALFVNVTTVSVGDGYSGLFVKGVGTQGYSLELGGTSESGKVRGRIEITGSNTSSFSGVLTPGTWYHLAFTCDRDADQVLYINGVEIDRDATIAVTLTNALDLLIASDNLNRYLNGSLQHVMQFNEAKTPNEVKIIAEGNYP